jgi:Ca2+:H+ antiporter
MSKGRIALNSLLVFLPIAAVLEYSHGPATARFLCACIAIVPLAGWIGHATDALAARAGAGIGGLLNATFGNAAELIIAIAGLRRGLFDVVKASLTGSIIGNLLFILGMAAVVGGARRPFQRFNRTAAGAGAAMLFLSVVSLGVPDILHQLHPDTSAQAMERLSIAISIVLIATYGLGLLFSLRTHAYLYAGENLEKADAHHMSAGRAVLFLAVAAALTAWLSEIAVGSVEDAAHSLGLRESFVGVVVLALVGNAAEHSTAVVLAIHDKMDVSLNIAIESSKQIALFVAPVLVLLSLAIAPHPMSLEFAPFEVVAVGISVAVTALISLDGETNWLEGVQLLAIYGIIALAFFFGA